MMSVKKLIIATLLTVSFAVSADFMAVNKRYNAGDYQKSFPQFRALAQRGNAMAQVALATSYAMGHGTKVDYQYAFAWALMAMDNNHLGAKTLYHDYRTKVPSRRQAKTLYRQLKSKFGVNALNAALFPQVFDDSQPLIKSAIAVSTPEPEYPVSVYESKTSIWAITQFDVNENGLTKNVKILTAYPSNAIDDVVVKAINRWQFKPSYDEHNNPIRHDNQIQLFELYNEHDNFANSEQHQAILTKAKQGSAVHQYLYAKLVESKRLSVSGNATSALDWLIKSAVNGYGKAQFALFQCLSVQGYCQADRAKALKWLITANDSGHLQAKMLLAKAYLMADNPLLPYSPIQALAMLQSFVENDDLAAITYYANLLARSEDQAVKNSQKAIKYARQAMALDNNNPLLLAVLAIAYNDLKKSAKAQDLLMQAVTEAELRAWPIDYYVNLLDEYQRATLLVEPAAQ